MISAKEIIKLSYRTPLVSRTKLACCLSPVILMALFLSLPVIAHDPSEPRSGCPPVEEEIVDLQILADMLANTKAVSLLTKLSLKKDIDKVLKRLNQFHDGKSKFTLGQLEEQYNLLLMKIAIHLQDNDLILHRHLCNAWLVIWEDLRDYDRFKEQQS